MCYLRSIRLQVLHSHCLHRLGGHQNDSVRRIGVAVDNFLLELEVECTVRLRRDGCMV